MFVTSPSHDVYAIASPSGDHSGTPAKRWSCVTRWTSAVQAGDETWPVPASAYATIVPSGETTHLLPAMLLGSGSLNSTSPSFAISTAPLNRSKEASSRTKVSSTARASASVSRWVDVGKSPGDGAAAIGLRPSAVHPAVSMHAIASPARGRRTSGQPLRPGRLISRSRST
jgi:hypothetical protein